MEYFDSNDGLDKDRFADGVELEWARWRTLWDLRRVPRGRDLDGLRLVVIVVVGV